MLKKLKKRSPFFALLKTMHGGEMNAMLAQSMEKKSKISLFKHNLNISPSVKRLARSVFSKVISLAFIFFLAYMGYNAKIDYPTLINMAGFSILFFTILFSFMYSISSLFMSKDILFYATLPLPSRTLTMGKILDYLYSNCVLMDGCVILPTALACAYKLGLNAMAKVGIYIVLASLSSKMLLLLLMLLLVGRVKLFKNKDRFLKVVNIFYMFVAISLGVLGNVMGSNAGSLGNVMQKIATHKGLSPWTVVKDLFLWPNIFLEGILADNNLRSYVSLLFSLILVVLGTSLVLLYANKKYLVLISCLNGSAGTGAKRLNRTQAAKALAPLSVYNSYRKTDYFLLKRNPQLYTYFLLTPILMPVYILACIVIGGFFKVGGSKVLEMLQNSSIYLEALRNFMRTLHWDSMANYPVAFVLTIVLVFLFWSDTATANQFMRDGKDFRFYQSLPLPLTTYIAVKYQFALKHGSSVFVVAFMLLLILLLTIFASLPVLTAVMLICLIVGLYVTFIQLSLFFSIIRVNFDFDIETDLVRKLKGFMPMLNNIVTELLILAVPALAVFLNFGKSLGFDAAAPGLTKCYLPAIFAVYYLVTALATAALLFGCGAKLLQKK